MKNIKDNFHNYTNKEYHHTNEYDTLIKNELKIDSWVFLSRYIVFEPHTKRKFIIKKYIFDKTRWTLNANLQNTSLNKNHQELDKIYSFEYENFKNKYNEDIYPYIFNEITYHKILDCFKYCCNHDFLPNILSETDNFLEVEYFDSSEWRPTTPRERSTDRYFTVLDSYYSYIKDLELCITIDCHNYNVMVNRKTGKFKNIDIEDLWPPNHFIPNICWYHIDKHEEFSAYYILRTDYSGSHKMFNHTLEYYSDLLKVINTDRIYIHEKPIYCTDDYKNLPHKI